jgi:hypothetical protein
MTATVNRTILCFVDQVITALGRSFTFGKVAQSDEMRIVQQLKLPAQP